jgi:hypothetical protein
MTTCTYCPMPNGEHHRGCCVLSLAKSTTFHVALSVDVDRYDDSALRARWIRGLKIAGKRATVKSLRRACGAARAKGLEVFPPCDNVDARGYCQGHPDTEGT